MIIGRVQYINDAFFQPSISLSLSFSVSLVLLSVTQIVNLLSSYELDADCSVASQHGRALNILSCECAVVMCQRDATTFSVYVTIAVYAECRDWRDRPPRDRLSPCSVR